MSTQNNESHTKRPGRGGHMGGPMGGMGTGEKAKDFKGSILKLLGYMSKYKFALVIVVILSILSTVFNILGPNIMGTATTEIAEGVMRIITGDEVGIRFDVIARILITIIILYVLSAGFSYLLNFVMTNISMKVIYKLRKEINDKINKLPLSYFDKKTNGEVLSFVTNDVDVIGQNLNQSITQIITSLATIIGILVMMIRINLRMTIVALLVLPISVVIIALIVKKSQKYFTSYQEYLGHVNGHIEEMYSSHVVVKAFNGEKKSIAKFNENNDVLYKMTWKSQFFSGLMMPIINIIGNLGYVVITILGGSLAISGTISIGQIQAFIQYMRQFTQPISQVANISNVLQQTAAASERIFEFLGEKEEDKDVEDVVNVDEIKGDVTFAHIDFGYSPEKTIIHDFSGVFEQGNKIAIVGPTGAGKTTIVKLLMRFYELNHGAILIDGYSTKQFSRNSLRSMFGMVLQDTWLYNATIMENIRYGRLDATDEEVIEAAKAAQVDHFVRTLPDGYNMVLNEEANNVSQGQKQLITIARAILSNPKILILDEATSSVDTRTEILIQKAMDNLMKGRTSFVIAHRLSTIKDADIIIVMDKGDVVEQGNHEELLAKNGFYANLYNSQFEKVN